jgi:hypothetical protein
VKAKDFYPADWRPWDKRRKRFRWRWGDPTGELFQADKDYGSYCHSERLTILHPQLREAAHHDLRWDTRGHEAAHCLFPTMTHARIYKLERAIGQFLHDFSGCTQCARPRQNSRSSR